MTLSRRNKWLLGALLLLLPALSLMHLKAGKLYIDWHDLINSVLNYDENDVYHILTVNVRIPRLITAFIAGSALSVAGLLMQTLFRNPLAGPYVLGINSGASLFVACTIMTGIPLLNTDLGIIANALLGAFLSGIIILSFSRLVKSHLSLLLIGLMLGSFTSAIISVLQTTSSAEALKHFTLWSLGSLQHVELEQIPLIAIVFTLSALGAFLLNKPLNALLLGEEQARLLGINERRLRIGIIVIAAALTGLITAYCGPITFVGLAVPNLVRLILKTQHHGILILFCLLLGGMFVLLCDVVIQYMEPYAAIPINVFTSIIGAPVVVLLVLNRLR